MSIPFVATWKKAPFIRLTTFLIAGILAENTFHFSVQPMYIALAATITVLLLTFFVPVSLYYKYQPVFGICIATMVTLIGCLHFHVSQSIPEQIPDGTSLLLSVDEPPIEKPASWKMECSIISYAKNDSSRPYHRKIIVYIRKDSSFVLPQLHQSIVINRPLHDISSSGNPGAFDYSKFLKLQHITKEVWLSSDQYRLLPSNNSYSLWQFIYTLRDHIIVTLKKFIPDKNAVGLAEALLIGYRNDLDRTLVQAYSNAGVVHIIAISGLHLGLIYWLLIKLVSPVRKKRYGSLLSAVITVSGIWIFTLLAGAQPSVLRSAFMFTCIAIGECLKRRSSIYNSLAFSASLLLIINPNWLWDLGFQLSYSALLGILLFNKRIYELWPIRNKYPDMIWKSVAVTLAAQILTTPICIYQFHQFPVYFLITNLIAVPLSSGILILEIFICIVSFISPLAIFTGTIATWLIKLMNAFIIQMNSLPVALINSLQIDGIQELLLAIALLLIMHWLSVKRVLILYLCLFCFIVIGLIRLYSIRLSSKQQKLIIYNTGRHSAIDIIHGNHSSFICDSSLLADKAAFALAVGGSRILHRVYKEETIAESQPIEVYRYGPSIIARVEKLSTYLITDEKISVDVLILANKRFVSLLQCITIFNPKKIVFDNNVPAYRIAKMRKELDSLLIVSHDLNTEGAFVMNLN